MKNFNYRDYSITLRADNGKYLTKGLFYEYNNKEAFYTLRPENHIAKSGKEYVSLYQIFMESVDEHDCAMKTLGSKAHWKKLLDCNWFMEGYEYPSGHGSRLDGLSEWRKDMKARDESIAKRTLMEQVEEGNVAAAKAIIENNKEKKPVGRTTKTKPQQPKQSNSSKILQLVENGNG